MKNPRRRKAKNDAALMREYRAMRGRTGLVGRDAESALSLARARAEYRRRNDVVIEWIPEQESYESVYGEKPPENAEFYTVVVKIKGQHAASLGFVDDMDRTYMRQVENELLAEAFANEKGKRRHNPIKGPGKFEGELYVIRYAYDDPDEQIGSVDELGWYGNFSGKIKGRGPFHIIVQETGQGFVYGKMYDSEKAMRREWNLIERDYEKFYAENAGEWR